MQYYLDGFRGGDPDIQPAAPAWRAYGPHDPLPDQVDVLIAGTGPAGLCLAAQLARFPSIRTMIVEKDPANIEKGKADGINTRTMEMFQAFGFADTVKREGYWVNQTAFWMPDPANPARIKRIGRVQDVADDSSEMPHILINQARLHQLFLDQMQNAPARLQPDYNWSVVDLQVADVGEYPVTVTLQDTGVNWGEERQVRARYVVGCDGARSNVRRAIGGTLQGDAAHQAWGVMDVLVNTDFPDIRFKCLVGSAGQGNILILPREGGYLVRFYVELDKLAADERVSGRGYTASDLIAAANRIMAPYTLQVKQVVWWSIYEIGHRLTDRFDDGTTDRAPRVFTAGDACHTHSPKAGQGMNVSMQDTFNLGWKLAHVLTGRAAPDLLRSYSAERQTEARRLIDTDQEWARIMSAPPGQSALDSGDEPRIVQQFKANLDFTGGVAVQYGPSNLTGTGAHQALATGLPIGKRFHSAPVVRVADAKQMQLGHVHQADGRWRLYAFAGADARPVIRLCDWLTQNAASPIRRHTRPGEDPDAVIDLRAVFPQTFDQIALKDMPPLLKPVKGKLGLQDHEKVFCLDHKGLGDIYTMRGIDREAGCIVIVRPDQYVAEILPLDDVAGLSAFFEMVLLPVSKG